MQKVFILYKVCLQLIPFKKIINAVSKRKLKNEMLLIRIMLNYLVETRKIKEVIMRNFVGEQRKLLSP
jgi:hypothetical protein